MTQNNSFFDQKFTSGFQLSKQFTALGFKINFMVNITDIFFTRNNIYLQVLLKLSPIFVKLYKKVTVRNMF